MFHIHFTFLIIFGISIVAALQLPPEIKKCRKTDEKCMAKSISDALLFFADGNKDFGFPKLEPFYVEKLEIEADPHKSVTLNQRYDNLYMYGMTKADVKEFSLKDDGKTCLWEMVTYTYGTRMAADYSLTGQILIFPINGHGRCNVTMTGITNKHTAKCEHYMKKGKSHLKFTTYTMEMSVESCFFDFPNIIPGNEQISKEVGKTVNENALEILKDVKGGFEQVFSKLHQSAANNLFAKIPEGELFLP